MRLFTTATILAALFVIGFTPNPASAKGKGYAKKCASYIAKVEENLEQFSSRPKQLEWIEDILRDAKAFQKDGKNGKCVKVLKKVMRKMNL